MFQSKLTLKWFTLKREYTFTWIKVSFYMFCIWCMPGIEPKKSSHGSWWGIHHLTFCSLVEFKLWGNNTSLWSSGMMRAVIYCVICCVCLYDVLLILARYFFRDVPKTNSTVLRLCGRQGEVKELNEIVGEVVLKAPVHGIFGFGDSQWYWQKKRHDHVCLFWQWWLG